MIMAIWKARANRNMLGHLAPCIKQATPMRSVSPTQNNPTNKEPSQPKSRLDDSHNANKFGVPQTREDHIASNLGAGRP